MKSKRHGTTLLRVIGVLCGIFFLLVPRREIAEWSLQHVVLYYSVVVGYIAIASIRIRKISQSMWLTAVLCCVAAVPLLSTLTQVVASVLKTDLAGMDAYTWGGLLFILVLELLLPCALVVEFRTESKSRPEQTCA